MYDGDSFFTLGSLGRSGLALVSLLLFALVCAAVRSLRLRCGRPAALVAAPVVFALFVWLSPQVYYSYYLVIFDGLPVQNVIKAPPAPQYLLQLMTFTGRANLSAHAQGLLFWALIVIALFGRRRQPVARHQ